MAITAPVRKVVQYPTDAGHATTLKAWVDAVTAAGNAGTLVADSLSADETGRAAMEADYFNAATVADKFDAASFAANATCRAIIANDFFDAATIAAVVDAKAIDTGSIADSAIEALQLNAEAVTEPKVAPSILTGKHAAVGAAGNTVGILVEEFIITCADGADAVTEKTTLDATYGKIVVEDVYFVKGSTTGGATDSVQLCTDAAGNTPVSSALALNNVAEGGVVRTTSLLNTAFDAGAKFYVKRVKTTANNGTMYIRARRVT